MSQELRILVPGQTADVWPESSTVSYQVWWEVLFSLHCKGQEYCSQSGEKAKGLISPTLLSNILKIKVHVLTLYPQDLCLTQSRCNIHQLEISRTTISVTTKSVGKELVCVQE